MHDESTVVVHDGHTEETITAVSQFNDALNRHDLDGVMALMTDDCVLDTTWPPPDGQCITGQAAV